MTEIEAWAEYLHEAEHAYELARDRQMGLWISEHRLSEGYLEAVERTKRTKLLYEACLTAYEAFMEYGQ